MNPAARKVADQTACRSKRSSNKNQLSFSTASWSLNGIYDKGDADWFVIPRPWQPFTADLGHEFFPHTQAQVQRESP